MMKLGMVLFDALSLLVMCALWGLAVWCGLWVFGVLGGIVWAPLAVLLSALSGLLAMIAAVGLIHHLLPAVRPGRYKLLQDRMFFIWVSRFILQRALLPPGLRELIFAHNTLRFLALRALGARVAFGASMSSDVTVLDPWLLQVDEGAVLGTGSLVAGHMIDRGELVLATVHIEADALLAARVMVGPGVRVRRGARVLTGAMVGERTDIGERAIVGADARVERDVRIAPGVRVGASTFIHKHVYLERDTAPREEVMHSQAP